MEGNKVWTKIQSKIQDFSEGQKAVRKAQEEGKKVVFTNGCFDILHYGHLYYLAEARSLGDFLVVGVNSRASVARLKGAHRPINEDTTRYHLLAALECVDLVIEFSEDTPVELIKTLRPDILVKGGDYAIEEIVGADFVQQRGGKVQTLAFVPGYSTTKIEERIKGFENKNSVK